MSDLTLATVSAVTEDQARETFEHIRWPNGPVCPHCGTVDNSTKFRPRSERKQSPTGGARPGVWKCNACGGQFTVTVNTVMESSHIPLRLWLMAFTIMCSAKKGISALQLQRQLGIGSYRTAWFLCHRIREAKKREPLAGLLKGTVEADETYVGGKPRKPAGPSRGTGERKRRGGGRSTRHRTPVVALVERGGRAVAKPTIDATAQTLSPVVRANVNLSATFMTDAWRGYIMVGREFAGGHHRVDHGSGEYVRGSAHVNEAESFFALLKRGIIGSFHHVSPEHLGRYRDEFAFRWSLRSISDSQRTEIAIRQTEGRRVTYKPLATR
jgi:transposase-like protein